MGSNGLDMLLTDDKVHRVLLWCHKLQLRWSMPLGQCWVSCLWFFCILYLSFCA